MFNILLWHNSRRILFGLICLLVALFILPHEITVRLWVGVALGLLCPLLVLGRRRALNREVYALILRGLPKRRRWQLWGLTPSFFIVMLWSLVIARGSWRMSLIYGAWGICCVSIADLFDKRSGRLAEAWGSASLSVLLLGGAPFWGALMFGRTAFSPWIATLCISAHPVYTGLKSEGYISLQDALLYEVTQSGLVEVYPLPWWSSPLICLAISAICWELTARAQLRESL